MTRLSLRALRADRRGAAVIEMALVAPVFALMIIGIVDISNAYTRKLGLEQASQRAIEKVMQTTGITTVEDTITTEVLCQVNGMNADSTCKSSPITASNVTVSYRLECLDSSAVATQSSVTTDSTAFDDMICPVNTREARYIQVNVTDKYSPLFPVHFASFTSGDGTYHLSATAGMRTE